MRKLFIFDILTDVASVGFLIESIVHQGVPAPHPPPLEPALWALLFLFILDFHLNVGFNLALPIFKVLIQILLNANLSLNQTFPILLLYVNKLERNSNFGILYSKEPGIFEPKKNVVVVDLVASIPKLFRFAFKTNFSWELATWLLFIILTWFHYFGKCSFCWFDGGNFAEECWFWFWNFSFKINFDLYNGFGVWTLIVPMKNSLCY